MINSTALDQSKLSNSVECTMKRLIIFQVQVARVVKYALPYYTISSRGVHLCDTLE